MAEQTFEERLADITVMAVKQAAAPLLARMAALERQRTEDVATIAALGEKVAQLRERVAVVEATK
jgi:hypothetical protein